MKKFVAEGHVYVGSLHCVWCSEVMLCSLLNSKVFVCAWQSLQGVAKFDSISAGHSPFANCGTVILEAASDPSLFPVPCLCRFPSK